MTKTRYEDCVVAVCRFCYCCCCCCCCWCCYWSWYKIMSSIDPQNIDLLYRYDPGKPWSHRANVAPSESSVQRGKTFKKVSKMKKVYVSKRNKNRIRTNAPFKDVHAMVLECCRNSCLSGITRQDISFQRRQLYAQNYASQNYSISSHIQRKILISGKNKLIYTLPALGQVCKTAFKKCFAISDKKISLLLKKKIEGAPTLQNDLRGKHHNNARKLLPSAIDAVVAFIKGYNPRPSHYRREVTSKYYFDSIYSMRGIWKDFVRKNPNFKSTRLKKKNKGPPLSYSAFRMIFIRNMSHRYSFRIARVDTCQRCDMYSKRLQDCEKAMTLQLTVQARKEKNQDLKKITAELQNHLKEGERRYGALDYDARVLSISKD